MVRIRDIAPNVRIVRDQRRIQMRTACKLILLLLVGPLTNIITLVFSLEREVPYSFKDLGVETLQLGFTVQKEINTEELGDGCSLQKLRLQKDDIETTYFLLCGNDAFLVGTADKARNPNFKITVTIYKDYAINVVVENDSDYLEWRVYGLLWTREGRFRVEPTQNRKDVRGFLNTAKQVIEKKCNRNSTHISTPVASPRTYAKLPLTSNYDTQFYRSSRLPELTSKQTAMSDYPIYNLPEDKFLEMNMSTSCKHGVSNEDLVAVGKELRQHIRFVKGSSFRVIKEEIARKLSDELWSLRVPSKAEKGENLTLLTRQGSNVSLFVLSLTAAIILLLRTICHFICHDDLLLGVENVLRGHFGIGCFDSMLQCDDRVNIDRPILLVRNDEKNDKEDYESDAGF